MSGPMTSSATTGQNFAETALFVRFGSFAQGATMTGQALGETAESLRERNPKARNVWRLREGKYNCRGRNVGEHRTSTTLLKDYDFLTDFDPEVPIESWSLFDDGDFELLSAAPVHPISIRRVRARVRNRIAWSPMLTVPDVLIEE